MNLIPLKKELNNLNISLNELSIDNYSDIENKWQVLEQNAQPQFFLSTKWIIPWLQQILPYKTAYLLQVACDNEILALGIFVEKKTRRSLFIHSTQWHLHRTGEENFDQIWIENNCFLIHTQYADKLPPIIWCWLESNASHVDEFIVNLYKEQHDHNFLNSTDNYQKISIENQGGYFINLDDFHGLDDFLASRSRNTRQKIKQSIKLLKEHGDINFSMHFDEQTQIEIINQTKQWHIEKWQRTSTPSGFLNPFFMQFHQSLIRKKHTETKSFVAKLSTNKDLIACLYGFIQRDTCYFYLSNIKPINDNKIKIGLTIHCLLIDYLISNAKDIIKYDFLAGSSQYKKSLSNGIDDYSCIIFQRKCLQFKIERKLKALKALLIG